MSRSRHNGPWCVGLALSVGGILLVSCSGDNVKKVPPPSGEAGAAGESAGDAAGTGAAGTGAAGTGAAGAGAAVAGQAGAIEPAVAGAAGATPEEAGAGGTGGRSGAGGGGAGGGGGALCDAPVTGRISIAFDATDPERVTTLRWTDSAATRTVNLVAEGGPRHCTDPQEFFGQSYGAPEGTLPAPVVGGHVASLLQCGADATIMSAALGCDPVGTPQVPVTTQYHFYGGTHDSEMRITRTFGFPGTTQVYAGTTGLRPYIPRVLLSALPNVIYPNQAGTTVSSVAAGSCGGDCITATGTSWNGKWFADVNPTSGLALIVLRDPELTSAVDLTVNTDGYSASNLASFVLVQPTLGWTTAITEIEYLCFADLTSWPQTQRDIAQLPPGCGP